MEDLTGKQLGQYQIVEILGTGGMATVYKAYQSSMARFVALKVLSRHLSADPDFVTRFKTESMVIASLEHPNILPVYDFEEALGYSYLVMRYIDGKNLSSLLQGQPLLSSQIKRITDQIAAALDYAHSRGVIHRDIKPSNVLLTEQGNCILSDFGLAKVLVNSSKLTATGAFLGTPTYASPEQCLGKSDIDQRSDVYSLGVILYEMATGRPPFDADTPMGVVIKHIHDPLPYPHTIYPNISEAVELVIIKALSKEVDSRYSTAGELAKAYSAAVGGQAPEINKIGIPPQTHENQIATIIENFEKHPGKISKKWMVLGFLILVLLVTCVAGAIWGMNSFFSLTTTPTQITRISQTIEVLPAKEESSPGTLTAPPPSLSPTRTSFATLTFTANLISSPSETPSPTASSDSFAVVAPEIIIVRSGPGVVYRWVEGSPYPAGTDFVIEGCSEDLEWYFVIIAGKLEGWVQVSDFETEIDVNTLQIITAPPTPFPPPTITPKPTQKKEKAYPPPYP